MGLAKLLGRLGVERGGQLGGAHHVGEQNGDRLRVSHVPRSPASLVTGPYVTMTQASQ